MSRLRPHETEHPLMRIGGTGDGGYLVPDDLSGIAAVFSPGVYDSANFEHYFLSRGIPCFLADRSVDGPPFEHPLLHFTKRHLAAESSGDEMTLGHWMGQCAPDHGDLILQMDIEGAEYEVLLTTPADLLQRFRVMVIEFHGLHRLPRYGSFKRIQQVFKQLSETHCCVHLHPNNCCQPRRCGRLLLNPVLEVTLLRRDRFQSSRPVTQLPHPLDDDNVPDRASVYLDSGWLSGQGGSQ